MKVITDNSKTSRNIQKAYESKKYIVSWKSVYQPHYSATQGQYYATEVYRASGNMTLAGRFFHFDAKHVNEMIGHNLLAEL